MERKWPLKTPLPHHISLGKIKTKSESILQEKIKPRARGGSPLIVF